MTVAAEKERNCEKTDHQTDNRTKDFRLPAHCPGAVPAAAQHRLRGDIDLFPPIPRLHLLRPAGADCHRRGGEHPVQRLQRQLQAGLDPAGGGPAGGGHGAVCPLGRQRSEQEAESPASPASGQPEHGAAPVRRQSGEAGPGAAQLAAGIPPSDLPGLPPVPRHRLHVFPHRRGLF